MSGSGSIRFGDIDVEKDPARLRGHAGLSAEDFGV